MGGRERRLGGSEGGLEGREGGSEVGKEGWEAGKEEAENPQHPVIHITTIAITA